MFSEQIVAVYCDMACVRGKEMLNFLDEAMHETFDGNTEELRE